MRGHAFLTSSAETEAAQESDRIRALVLHALPDLRASAAPPTCPATARSRSTRPTSSRSTRRSAAPSTRSGGAQHPSYDINLSGTGDVVMTDVRQTTATLVLGEELGRPVLHPQRRAGARRRALQAARAQGGARARAGRRTKCGSSREKASLLAKTQIDDGARVTLEATAVRPVAVEATRRRGGGEAPPTRYSVAGRNRIEVTRGDVANGRSRRRRRRERRLRRSALCAPREREPQDTFAVHQRPSSR